jgi:hypothetical protein
VAAVLVALDNTLVAPTAAVEAPAAASLEMLIASATVGNDDDAAVADDIGVAVTNGGSSPPHDVVAEPTF